jgi:hypothetical protein
MATIESLLNLQRLLAGLLLEKISKAWCQSQINSPVHLDLHPALQNLHLARQDLHLARQDLHLVR